MAELILSTIKKQGWDVEKTMDILGVDMKKDRLSKNLA